MGCNVNVCGCPFQSSHHATCSEMQRNAPADAGPRGPIFALTWQFIERWPEAPLCPGSLRHSALHLPMLHRLNRLQIVEINAPFLHFKAATFSTPSLRCDDLGTRSAQTGFALKAIPDLQRAAPSPSLPLALLSIFPTPIRYSASLHALLSLQRRRALLSTLQTILAFHLVAALLVYCAAVLGEIKPPSNRSLVIC